MIKPIVKNIVAVYFNNQRQPLVASEGYKKYSTFVWYGTLYRHLIKIIQLLNNRRSITLHADKSYWLI